MITIILGNTFIFEGGTSLDCMIYDPETVVPYVPGNSVFIQTRFTRQPQNRLDSADDDQPIYGEMYENSGPSESKIPQKYLKKPQKSSQTSLYNNYNNTKKSLNSLVLSHELPNFFLIFFLFFSIFFF